MLVSFRLVSRRNWYCGLDRSFPVSFLFPKLVAQTLLTALHRINWRPRIAVNRDFLFNMTSGKISRLWVLFCGRAPEDVNCVRTRNMPCSLHGRPPQLTLNVPGDVEQLSQLKCCYSYDALVQLADLLRCNPSELSSLQESAQDTRRAACQDLLRQKKASFIYDVLYCLVSN
jgi:hypothetical protein